MPRALPLRSAPFAHAHGLLACLLGAGLLFAVGCNASLRTAAPSRLHVEGNYLTNPQGERVTLRGVSFPDPFFLYRIDDRSVEEEIEHLADEWRVDVVRVPIYPELWQYHPRYLERYVDEVVREAGRQGLYVLLGWHAQGSIQPEAAAYEPEWGTRWPWQGAPTNPSRSLAVAGLKRLADRYGDQPFVLFSIFSEPAYIDWSAWRTEAEALVDVVREEAPESVVFVPGVNWGYDLRGALQEPVRRPNVVYETHPYPHKPGDWKTVVQELQRTEAVFIGEWGFLESEVGPDYDMGNYGRSLVAFCRDLGIGWVAWVWSDNWTPSLVRSFDDYTLTPYGRFVREQLQRPATDADR